MNFIFFYTLLISSFIAFSTNYWFQMWIALEVNMMMFIPLMFNKDNMSIQSMMKYFIVQSFSSSLFIVTLILSQKFTLDNLMCYIVTLAMATKLGLFPIFFWFPQVSEGISWMSFTLLSTWQKLIPLFIISSNTKVLLPFILVSSAMISCLLMFNQTSLRKLLAYSSLNHLSWMLLSILNLNLNWMFYFMIYSLIMAMMFMVLNPQNINSISEIKIINNKSQMTMIILTMMSLGGLPPLLGFLPKWIIISNNNINMILLFILIISSLMSIFIYMRIMYPMLFNKNLTQKMLNMKYYLPFTFNFLLLIPFSPLIFF